jgi:putative colanic acid biosynthesis UDP-glucose lipid carrier transferase
MVDLIARNATRLESVVRFTDVLLLYAMGIFADALSLSSGSGVMSATHTAVLYFCCTMAVVVFPQFALYSSWRGRSLILLAGNAILAILVVLIAGAAFGFMIRQLGELSITWLMTWFVFAFCGFLIYRWALYGVLSGLRKHGINSKRVIIVGYGSTGRELHQRARTQRWTGYDVVAAFVGDGSIVSGSSVTLDAPVEALSALDDIPAAVKRHQAHEVWITLPLAETMQLRRLQALLGNTLVDLRWVPDVTAVSILTHRTVEFLGMPVVELNHPASTGTPGMLKDIFDRAFAALVLILLSPLFIAIAIAIRIDSPGPILFRQPRLGLNGQRFKVLKFRSMRVHQEVDRVTQATRDDPRITTVGRFLRRTSLDELPQFFNVLMGDMSVVGPRPHALSHNDLYKEKLAMYMQRHRVKPGITGWAQINGHRGETDTYEKMAHRVQFDLYYIQHWSFWMDLKIIVWTAVKGWTSQNAY